MNKYCVVIGDNPELSRKVQEELFKAGFEWGDGDLVAINTSSPVLFINVIGDCKIHHRKRSQSLIAVDSVNNCLILTTADILNGGAMKLDGAKKVEPKTRWFLDVSGIVSGWYILRTDAGKDGHLRITPEGKFEERGSHKWGDERLVEESTRFIELTADDVAYIRDNAEKAKGLKYEFKKCKNGDSIINRFGKMETITYDIDDSRVAGYRYYKKADIVLNGTDQMFEAKTTYCHNCAKPVTPAYANYCRHCRAKLEK